MNITFDRNRDVLFRASQMYYKHSPARKIMQMISKGSFLFVVILIATVMLNLQGTILTVAIFGGLIISVAFAYFSFDYFLNREIDRLLRKGTPTGTNNYVFYTEAFTETINDETQECPYSYIKEVYIGETIIQLYTLNNAFFIIDRNALMSKEQEAELLAYFSTKDILIRYA